MQGQTNKKILSGKFQCTLRRNMTDAETLLWQALRGRQMAGQKFRRQHPYDDFILDFVCLESRLVIEVDGGQHGDRAAYDEQRTSQLRGAGFRVLRFWNHEVLQDIVSVRDRIWRALQTHPHPDPPLEGEGAPSVFD